MRRLRYALQPILCVTLLVRADTTNIATAFTALEQWKVAVANGDKAALAPFYAGVPPAEILVARNKIKSAETLDDELKFWAGLSSSGITNLTVKLLSQKTAQNQTNLVLRIECIKQNQPVFFRVFQVWVGQADRWHILRSLRTDFFPNAKQRLQEPTRPNPGLYPDPSQAQPQMTAALAAARRQNKRVLAIFGANWCYDCHVLEETFNSPEFTPLVRENYIVVHINVGEEGKDNNDMAAKFNVNVDRGVPSLAVLNPDGEVVVSQQNGEFQSSVKIGPEDVRTFLERWKPVAKSNR